MISIFLFISMSFTTSVSYLIVINLSAFFINQWELQLIQL